MSSDIKQKVEILGPDHRPLPSQDDRMSSWRRAAKKLGALIAGSTTLKIILIPVLMWLMTGVLHTSDESNFSSEVETHRPEVGNKTASKAPKNASVPR